MANMVNLCPTGIRASTFYGKSICCILLYMQLVRVLFLCKKKKKIEPLNQR